MAQQTIVRRNKRKPAPSTAPRTKKVMADFPIALYKETEAVAAELKMSRSGILRKAMEELLKARRTQKLKADIAAYFDEHDQLERELMEDFKYVDSETL
jgi:hypothetical protein